MKGLDEGFLVYQFGNHIKLSCPDFEPVKRALLPAESNYWFLAKASD